MAVAKMDRFAEVHQKFREAVKSGDSNTAIFVGAILVVSSKSGRVDSRDFYELAAFAIDRGQDSTAAACVATLTQTLDSDRLLRLAHRSIETTRARPSS
jgi:hypothetical protein